MKEIQIIPILLLAVSSSLDNFGTGISYGLRRICFPRALNLFIALLNSTGTLVAMLFGTLVSGFLGARLANTLGAAFLIAVGLSIFIGELPKVRKERRFVSEGPRPSLAGRSFISRIFSIIEDPFAAGLFCTGKVVVREGVLLAAALTLSNLATGVGAGMIGLNPLVTGAAVFLFSILAISTGLKIGNYSGWIMMRGFSGLLAGLLLVIMGIYELTG